MIPAPRRAPEVVLAVALAASAAMLWRMLDLCRHGIDFSDEGFYLVWIANPGYYPQSVSQFGFIYHPLFLLAGSDLVLLRQFNVLITALLAWVLVIACFRAGLRGPWGRGFWSSPPMLAVAAVLATSYPNLLNVWLPTPSYNTLALQALLIAGIGWMLAESAPHARSVLGWVLLGAGGWLAFMAKPTTALALAVVTVAYLVLSAKLRLRMVLLSLLVALVLLLASAWLIDGSVMQFVQRNRDGLALGEVMGTGQGLMRLLRVDVFRLSATGALLFAAVVLAGAGLTWVMVNGGTLGRWMGVSGTLAGSVLGLVLALGVTGWTIPEQPYMGMLTAAAAVAAAAAALLLQRTLWAGGFAREPLALAFCLLVLPHAYAFGSGNNYWQTASTAGIFWVLAGVTVLGAAARPTAGWQVFLPVAVFSRLIALFLLGAAVAHPYRQPEALSQQNHAVTVDSGRSRLLLSEGYGVYLDQVLAAARAAGFAPGTPVVDLSGQSPGTIFSLGARASGQAWLLGGYPGSERYAAATLAAAPCTELALAWLLVEPQGPRTISAKVLLASGISMEQDHVVVGRFRTPPGFGGHPTPSEQALLKPLRSADAATAACKRARTGTPKP